MLIFIKQVVFEVSVIPIEYLPTAETEKNGEKNVVTDSVSEKRNIRLGYAY